MTPEEKEAFDAYVLSVRMAVSRLPLCWVNIEIQIQMSSVW